MNTPAAAPRRVLMIAYHFPPLAGSSGIQRTLRFVQHLPSLGWEPLVLTTHPRAYERTSDDLNGDVPPGTVVRRAFALDAARHLSIGGRYPGAMARPDRWISWRFDGVRQGMRLIRELRPDAIWSTYPIATAHVIGAELQRRSGLPWIADFRDPMAQDDYPTDPQTWRSFERIEAEAMRNARLALFTTPGAAKMYRERYPDARARVEVLENGYDEESFAGAPAPSPRLAGGPLVLLHSGIVYPSERDPSQLFAALQRLVESGALRRDDLRIRFRASMNDGLLASLAERHRVTDLIELAPAVGYRDALAEMVQVDALLVMQAANCNAQIPAKIYEYLRAGRPVVTLTDPAGDTAGVLRGAGLDAIARLDSADEIAALLPRFLAAVRDGSARGASTSAVQQASRRARSDVLARALDEVRSAR